MFFECSKIRLSTQYFVDMFLIFFGFIQKHLWRIICKTTKIKNLFGVVSWQFLLFVRFLTEFYLFSVFYFVPQALLRW